MLNSGLYSSAKIDWETPQELFDSLNEEFAFTIDVCASESNTKCNNFYGLVDDGLSKDWQGVAWMNPPYGRGIDKWVKKAYDVSQAGCICVCLLPVRSDTRWWHNYVMKSAQIRLLNRRLSFAGSNNKSPFPAAIVVFDQKSNIPMLASMNV